MNDNHEIEIIYVSVDRDEAFDNSNANREEIIENISYEHTVIETSESNPLKSEKINELILGWADDLVLYFVLFILVMTFLFRPAVVRGQSMENTLYDGDILILTSTFYAPDYGDIIVLSRETNVARPLIKRVIALSGDVVNLDYDTGSIYVNGDRVDESNFSLNLEDGLGENTDLIKYPYTVPDNSVFVMGDHRGDSTDSRICGAIEYGQILGKAICRIYRNTGLYGGGFVDFNLYD